MASVLCEIRKLRRGAGRWLSRLLPVLIGGGLAGCGREDIRAYRVPKEIEPPAASRTAAAGRPQPHIHYEAPAGWVPREPGSMSVARFAVPGKAAQPADVAVVPLMGMRAGTKEIVDLWRQQVGLEPVKEEELPQMTERVLIGEQQGELFDLAGRDPSGESGMKARILVAMLRDARATWFFKMTGDDETVGEQKAAFLQFLKTVSVDYSDHSDHSEHAHGTSATASSAGGASTGGAAKEEGKPEWRVPAGWSEAPPTQMLLAKFTLGQTAEEKAEVTVSVFPGDVGGTLANVNRWRGQISLPSIEEAELGKLVASLDAAEGKALLVDMTGPGKEGGKPQSLVGAILPRGERTWFYKMMGDEAVVRREKAAFTEFVQTANHAHAH